MSRPSLPSDAELDVLKCFWREGDMSAREVQERLTPSLAWSSSTTRTVLERMKAKGLLRRRDIHGMGVYSVVQPKVVIVGALMRRLGALLEIDGNLPAAAFSGSQILDADDIAALEAVLDDTDGDAE